VYDVAPLTPEFHGGQELGVDKLGERRRLLLFLDELRSMQAAAAGSAPDGAP